MKNLKKQLKREAAEHTPDLYDSIVSQADAQGLFSAPATERNAVGRDGAVVLKSKRTAAIASCAAVIAVLAALAILLPIFLIKPSIPGGTGSPVRLSVSEFYGLGAVTAANFLNDAETSGVRTAGVRMRAKGNDDGVKKHISEFDRYFTAFNCFVSDNVAKTVSEPNDGGEFPEFQTKLTVESTDVLGNVEKYYVYYTETVVEKDDEKTEYSLVGVLSMNGTLYRLDGERESENDGDETEDDMRLMVYNESDPSSYTEIEKEAETEQDEKSFKYVYTVYSGGKKTEELEVEFESEVKDGRQEVDLDMRIKGASGEEEYEIFLTDGENAVYTVEYKLPDSDGEFSVRIRERPGGATYREYTFSDGGSIMLPAQS